MNTTPRAAFALRGVHSTRHRIVTSKKARQDVSAVLRDPSMGAKVLGVLSAYAEIGRLAKPLKNGWGSIVAGQAVASAVSQVIGDGRGVVYNDVDVFHVAMDGLHERKDQALAMMRHGHRTRLVGDYGELCIAGEQIYRLLRTRRRGLVNDSFCVPDTEAQQSTFAQRLVETFDLNCVQVGVRLEDQALVWSPAFEEFLRTRQMVVANIATPIHTAVRWFKKRAELAGIYGDDASAMTTLVAAFHHARREVRVDDYEGSDSQPYRSLRRSLGRVRFGQAFAEKAEACGTALSTWFDLREAPSYRGVRLFTLAPRGEVDKRLLDEHLPESCLPMYAQALHGRYKRHHARVVTETLATIAKIHRQRQSRSTASYARGALLCRYGLDIVRECESETDFARLAVTLAEHEGIVAKVGELDAKRLRASVEAIVDLARVRGAMVYGLVAVLEPQRFVPLAEVDVAQIRPWFEELLDRALADARAKLDARAQPLRPLMAPTHHCGWDVSELLDFESLLDEGVRQHHCVAGYFVGVVNEALRIVSFRGPNPQSSLTVSLVLDERWRPAGRGSEAMPRGASVWSLGEISGLQNRRPSDEERRRVKHWCTAANLTHQVRWRLGVEIAPAAALWISERLPESLAARLRGAGPVRLSKRIDVWLCHQRRKARKAIRERWWRAIRASCRIKPVEWLQRQAPARALEAWTSLASARQMARASVTLLRQRGSLIGLREDDAAILTLLGVPLPAPPSDDFDDLDSDIPF